MDYSTHYANLIAQSKRRQQELDFYERHHIKPRCLGGKNDDANLTMLTPREHQVAHKLLVKMHPGNIKLIYAANMMYCNATGANRKGVSPAWVRKKVADSKRAAWADDARRVELTQAMFKAWENEDRKIANSIRMKKYWSDPKARKENSVKLSAHWKENKLMTEVDVEEASILKSIGSTWSELASKFNVSRTTIRRYVAKALDASVSR